MIIAIDTNILGHEKYWRAVYANMNLKIGT